MAQTVLITQNKEILGGIPVFAGTRVPVQTLLDYLEKNHSIDDFLDDFPTVSRSQIDGTLEMLKGMIAEKHYESVA